MPTSAVPCPGKSCSPRSEIPESSLVRIAASISSRYASLDSSPVASTYFSHVGKSPRSSTRFLISFRFTGSDIP